MVDLLRPSTTYREAVGPIGLELYDCDESFELLGCPAALKNCPCLIFVWSTATAFPINPYRTYWMGLGDQPSVNQQLHKSEPDDVLSGFTVSLFAVPSLLREKSGFSGSPIRPGNPPRGSATPKRVHIRRLKRAECPCMEDNE